MPTSHQDTDERRRYYRIDDWVALEILPETGALSNTPPAFELLAEFHQLEFEGQPLLRQIAESDRILASYLRLHSRRMDLLARIMAQDLLRQIGPPRRVSLSEGGIRFPHNRALQEGSHYLLRLLLPQPAELRLKIRILRCRPHTGTSDTYPYEVAARFEEMTDTQRQYLARHILQKQARERRQARGEKL